MFCDDGLIEGVFGQDADVQEMHNGDNGVLAATVELQPKQQYVLWINARPAPKSKNSVTLQISKKVFFIATVQADLSI